MQIHTRIKNIFSIALPALVIFSACVPKKNNSSVKEKPNVNAVAAVRKGEMPPEMKLKSYFIDGCREKIKGNIEIAENLFKECLKIEPDNAAVNYELANIYRFTGLYGQALQCARIAALSNVKNEWYNLLYVECLHNKRMYTEAISRYEVMIDASPYRSDFYQGLASECTYAGKPDKAIQAYNRMEEKLGHDPEISLRKVNLYKQLKKWEGAESELKKLIVQDPKEARYYTFLAELYQDMGQPQKAMETYTEILKTEPNNPYLHLALADYYRQQKKDDEFFSEVKIAFKSPELDIDNKIKILVSYYTITEQKNKYLDQAYELCKLLVDSNPDEPKAHSLYADFLYRDKKMREARVELLKVLNFDKSKFAIWNELLICESDLNENDSLAKHSAEAMDLFPNQPVTYFLNGVAYMRLKQYKKAVVPFSEGKQFVYENLMLQVQFCSNLAEVYNNLKEYEKSDKEFEEAITADPNNGFILNNYAYYLSLRKQKLDVAEKYSKRALETNPNNVSYLDTYGWILFQQGKYEEAKTYFEKALEKGGFNRPAINEHYGDVLYKLNQKDKAIEYWKKSKEQGNNSELLNKKITENKYLE
jgi:tetratricopeptide (TPR) repeat protein